MVKSILDSGEMVLHEYIGPASQALSPQGFPEDQEK